MPDAALREWVHATRIAQGLPPVVEDVATIETVAAIMRSADVPAPRADEAA